MHSPSQGLRLSRILPTLPTLPTKSFVAHLSAWSRRGTVGVTGSGADDVLVCAAMSTRTNLDASDRTTLLAGLERAAVRDLVSAFLAEDIGAADHTTDAIVPVDKLGCADGGGGEPAGPGSLARPLWSTKFYRYSFNNDLMIFLQRPDAALVAGFKQLEGFLGRFMKMGEKGLAIAFSGVESPWSVAVW